MDIEVWYVHNNCSIVKMAAQVMYRFVILILLVLIEIFVNFISILLDINIICAICFYV
jgi:hypothetical protein